MKHVVDQALIKRLVEDVADNQYAGSKACRNLRLQVGIAAGAMSLDKFVQFMNALTSRIFELINSDDMNQRKTGIIIIDEMLKLKCHENVRTTMIVRFANSFRIMFQAANPDYEVLELASKALGHLCRTGGPLTGGIVEFQTKQCLEWLQASNRYEQRRLTAVLVLKELAESTPTLFNVFIPAFLDCIWVALRDPNVTIRECGVHALRVVLRNIGKRRTSWMLDCCFRLYREVLNGLRVKDKKSKSDSNFIYNVHGSLLTIGELLRGSPEFIVSRFTEVCKSILNYKDHPDEMIKCTVVSLLPALASLSPQLFLQSYLNPCLDYIIFVLKEGGVATDTAFIALGQLSIAVGLHITPKLGQFVSILIQALTPRSRSKHPKKGAQQKASSVNAALHCISMLARAVHLHLLPYVESLIDVMFENELSPSLIEALMDVTQNIPSLLPSVQARLLFTISAVLNDPHHYRTSGGIGDATGKGANPEKKELKPSIMDPKLMDLPVYGCPLPLTAVGSPQSINMYPPNEKDAKGGRKGGRGAGEPLELLNKEAIERGYSLIGLALQTLGTFNFRMQDNAGPVQTCREHCSFFNFYGNGWGMEVALFVLVCNTVVCYLDHYRLPIRSEAVMTMLHFLPLFEKGGFQEKDPQGPHCIDFRAMLFTTLKKVVNLTITDSVPLIRLSILSKLHPCIDKYLAQADCLHILFFTLQDENFAVRKGAVILLGRLSALNPAFILPRLRKLLMQLAQAMQQSHIDAVSHEENSKLLGYLIDSCPVLVKPHVKAIFHLLMPQLCFSCTQNPVDTTNKPATDHSLVASNLLAIVGKLVVLSPSDIVQYMDVILPYILQSLQDPMSPIQKKVALRTLTQITTATGFVVEPYSQHPTLLPVLMHVLKEGRSWSIRRQVSEVLGTIGALDPLRYTVIEKLNQQSAAKLAAATNVTSSNPLALMTSSTSSSTNPDYLAANALHTSDEYFPSVAIAALMKIQADPGLVTHRLMMMRALMFITRSLGLKCVPFLPQIIPPCLVELQTCTGQLRHFLLHHMCLLIRMVNQHIVQFLPSIFDVVVELLSKQQLAQNSFTQEVLLLAKEIILILRQDFDVHLPVLIPLLLNILNSDPSWGQYQVMVVEALGVLQCVAVCCSPDNYIYVFFPTLLALAVREEHPIIVRAMALEIIRDLYIDHNLNEYASRIFQAFVRILRSRPDSAVFLPLMLCLCIMAKQMGIEFLTFEPVLRPLVADVNMLLNNSAVFSGYYRIVGMLNVLKSKKNGTSTNGLSNNNDSRVFNRNEGLLMEGVGLDSNIDPDVALDTLIVNHKNDSIFLASKSRYNRGAGTVDASVEPLSGAKLYVNQTNLMKAWSATQHSTKEDWIEWMRRFSLEVLKESPRASLRACSELAGKYPPLARQLFNHAFLSCWCELQEHYQDSLIQSFDQIFQSRNMVPEIITSLLDLAEFMEHHSRALPIDISTLGDLSRKCCAYVKALHYKEKEFQLNPANTVKDLIAINYHLQQPEAAIGILKFAQKHHAIQLEESWFEKLQRWEDALTAYERKQVEDPHNVTYTLGAMRCLEGLASWEKLADASKRLWHRTLSLDDISIQRQIAYMAANAAVNLGRLDDMQVYTSLMSENWVDGCFYRAIQAVHNDNLPAARRLVNRARALLVHELNPIVTESYSRTYRLLVKGQQLVELSEVINYKQTTEQERAHIRQLWRKRLGGCAKKPEVWQQILSIRSLVVEPHQDINTWISFCSICCKSLRFEMCQKILWALMGIDPTLMITCPTMPLPCTNPHVTFAAIKYLWAAGFNQGFVISRLNQLIKHPALRMPSLDEIIQRGNSVLPRNPNIVPYVKVGRINNKLNNLLKLTHMSPEDVLKGSLVENEGSDLLDDASWIASDVTAMGVVTAGEDAAQDGGLGTATQAVPIPFYLEVPKESNATFATPEQIASEAIRDLKCMCHLKQGRWHAEILFDVSSTLVSSTSVLGNTVHGQGVDAADTPASTNKNEVNLFSQARKIIGFQVSKPGQQAGSTSRSETPVAGSTGEYYRGPSDQSSSVEVEGGDHNHAEFHAIIGAYNNSTDNVDDRIKIPAVKSDDGGEGFGSIKIMPRSKGSTSQARGSGIEKNELWRVRPGVIPIILDAFYTACVCNPQSFKAWHGWAMFNLHLVANRDKYFPAATPSPRAGVDGEGKRDEANECEHTTSSGEQDESNLDGGDDSRHAMSGLKHNNQHRGSGLSNSARKSAESTSAKRRTSAKNADRSYLRHVVAAVQGFFHSISLEDHRSLNSSKQDTLRVLALWFAHGTEREVQLALEKGFATISIDIWLAVVPQIIARIHTPEKRLRTLIFNLLTAVGRAHPQALVYSLTVASKSHSVGRRTTALRILNHMTSHSPLLVEQALVASEELVRVAILWQELWREAIEEASRYWFGKQDSATMLATLAPLHAMMEKGPVTQRERTFNLAFGSDLAQAKRWCEKFRRSGRQSDLNRAWDLYSTVFRKMNKQMGQLTTIELQEVSPLLVQARNMVLAIPGSYEVGQPVVTIAYFDPTLRVIESKQHPRRLSMYGSNGREYEFLLKGHEDIRQDERVMQLFGLVNTLLSFDLETVGTDLSIHRFAVIPLSPNSGLIEWVPECDTIHLLIKNYRDTRKIMLNVEQRLMLKVAPQFLQLTLLQKLEAFEYAIENTRGQDLCKVMWLKSASTEAWLDHRTSYSRSLAVMSMVGYVLGLGDRHPCNLMLARNSGKVIHIDFGDCFEVAMYREKYPEKVPFRLTRMLINAMEVSGFEGTFRSTCEKVMTVLRNNKNSVMAVLEAFVYDPLINWRLLNTEVDAKANSTKPKPAPGSSKPLTPSSLLDEEGNNPANEGLPAFLLAEPSTPETKRKSLNENDDATLTDAGAEKESTAPAAKVNTSPVKPTAPTKPVDFTKQIAGSPAPRGSLLAASLEEAGALPHQRTAEERRKKDEDGGFGMPALQKKNTARPKSSMLANIPPPNIALATNAASAMGVGHVGQGSRQLGLNTDVKEQADKELAEENKLRKEASKENMLLGALTDDNEQAIEDEAKDDLTNVGDGNLDVFVVGSSTLRSMSARSSEHLLSTPRFELDEKAVSVVKRVEHKLNGTDFDPDQVQTVVIQVQNLILQATDNANLCVSYIGWCPFW